MSTDTKNENSQLSEQAQKATLSEHRKFRDDEFWKQIPGWESVSHDEFADHKWQNKNAIRKVEQVEKVLGSRVSKETMDTPHLREQRPRRPVLRTSVWR